MPRFTTAEGVTEVGLGDDMEVELPDITVEGGVRLLTGQVTRLAPEENAVWVRGVRVDLAEARIVRSVGSDEPENLTPAPE